ncbi:type II secretion system F family protein [Aliamphritea spongicola]|uniref:type II secretion system F family protein n=1 Tax=Aliamphritea spongicola TaxID=707589 RepID=UPI00196A9B18|nr:type II secretion system F family protein [Aliamphritea spongicola]MBN3562701.1 type II secretion system F family protein [Aliamphritea spongicola]
MSEQHLIFGGMVFVAVFLLMMGLTIPVFGESQKARRNLKKRVLELSADTDANTITLLLRKKYLRSLSPAERWLESLPGMESLGDALEKADYRYRAYQVVLGIALLMALGAGIAWFFSRNIWIALVVGVICFFIPVFKIIRAKHKRIAVFEEQLPDAIDIMKRAIRAGHPFSESLHLVAEEMDGPVGQEFRITFADLNYGNDLRRAMLGLLHRVPSIPVMALVSCILIQKDTGGDLTEILERIGKVIRERFQFQRRVKTLSAEGRLSAWILVLVPFALVIVVSLTSPDYLPMLLDDPMGLKLIAFAFVGMIIGVYWINRVLRIEV